MGRNDTKWQLRPNLLLPEALALMKVHESSHVELMNLIVKANNIFENEDWVGWGVGEFAGSNMLTQINVKRELHKTKE